MAYVASDFLKALRRGTANQRSPWLPPWCVTLGLSLPCGIDDVKAAYRRLAKSAHPDVGGKAEDFVLVEGAYRDALNYCLRAPGPPSGFDSPGFFSRKATEPEAVASVFVTGDDLGSSESPRRAWAA